MSRDLGKADLHRWRETFAENLRGWGVEAEATRQATRGRNRNYDALWRIKARDDGRLRMRQAPEPGKTPQWMALNRRTDMDLPR